MTRRLVALHTSILIVVIVALLVAPVPLLASFAIDSPSFGATSLLRVMAGLVTVVAVISRRSGKPSP